MTSQSSEHPLHSQLPPSSFTADILIAAPHPDDEILCCSGVIAQAVAAKKKLLIVVFTNGDALRRHQHERNIAYGHRRFGETLRAVGHLGVVAQQVIFLGYPDSSHFGPSEYTGKSETYGHSEQDGGKLDYHTLRFGKPAPYEYDSVVGDIEQIMRDYTPSHVYLPVSSDTHPDHKITPAATEEAIKRAGLHATKHYWIVHAWEGDAKWPPPRCRTTCAKNPIRQDPYERLTPHQPLKPPLAYPSFDEEVPAAPKKQRLIEMYESQVELNPYVHGYLISFAKKNEGFWKRDITVVERNLRFAFGIGLSVLGGMIILYALLKKRFRKK
jgi:LmbE family N-acetylglucosaminyl deacetylase